MKGDEEIKRKQDLVSNLLDRFLTLIGRRGTERIETFDVLDDGLELETKKKVGTTELEKTLFDVFTRLCRDLKEALPDRRRKRLSLALFHLSLLLQVHLRAHNDERNGGDRSTETPLNETEILLQHFKRLSARRRVHQDDRLP